MRPGYSARPSKESVEQAKAALDVFRGMQTTLTAYARRLTGRADVEVIASKNSNGSTDGTKIYYRPPIALGKKLRHESWHCDRRDERGQLRCAACRQREELLSTIYHEIAHIWFQSFGGISAGGKRAAVEASVNGDLYRDTPFTEGIRERIRAADTGRMSYLDLANLISPWMQILVNSLEDARIERALFKALPGTRVMLTANVAQILTTGVEGRNPRTGEWDKILWKDRKLNEQVAVALYCRIAEFDYRDWFDPWVVWTLDDEDLQPLIEQVRRAGSVESVFITAFPILALLRTKYGYFKSDTDPAEPEPPAEEDSREDEPAAAEEGPSGGTDSAGDDGDKVGEDAGKGVGDHDEASKEGSELSEESDGGDTGESGAGGSPEDLEATDERSEGEADGAGDPDGDGSGAGDEVPEEVPDSGESESGSSRSGDSGDPVDGSGSGEPVALDGLPGEHSGDEVLGEPGDDSDESGESTGRRAGEGAGDDDLIDREWDDTPSGTSVPKPGIEFGDEYGAEKEVAEATGHHEHKPREGRDTSFHEHESAEDVLAISLVLEQGEWFDEISTGLSGVQVYKEGDRQFRGGPRVLSAWERGTGAGGDFRPTESLIGQAVMQARITFQANDRGKHERGLKRGRVHGGSLASKAPFNDPRMFERKTLPGRNSYFVGLGLDISGSTAGVNLDLIKRIAFAEAEMLSRLGVPFYMYAHTGGGIGKYQLQMHELKGPDEPWNDKTRIRLDGLGAAEANLDGHTMEFYRKLLDRQREKTRILHYYTDGAMPCENGPEERSVLEREIRTFRQRGYTLVGVGVRTTAPKAYGLDTVEVRKPEDITKVINDLRIRLQGR